MENKMNQQPMQNLANGGRIALGKGSKKGVKPAGGLFETLFYNKFHPFLSALNTSEIYDILSPGGGLYADGGRAGYSRGKLVKGLASLIDKGRKKLLEKFKRKKSQSELFKEDVARIKKEMEIEDKKFYDGLKPGGKLEQNIEKVTGYKFPGTDEITRVIKKKMGNRKDNVLKEFDITNRKPNAMGGRIALGKGGLAGLLGE